jgi:hypothetical protein
MPDEGATPRSRSDSPEAVRLAASPDDTPDLRWQKVVQVRQALDTNAYRIDDALDAILAPLAGELGFRCRDGAGDCPSRA